LAEPERLADITQNRTSAIRDHVGNHGGSFPAIASIAILNHLFPAIGFEVEVDVGWPAALFGEKALEWKSEADGIDAGEP
jgi:hypothetical protein